jgi:hypothetical protein
MSAGLHYLDVGLGIAVFVGILWSLYSLAVKSQVKRGLQIQAKSLARQPWGGDKAGGRGNR